MSIHLQHAHRLAAGVAMLAASVCSFAESRLAGTTPREAFGSEPVARLVGSALNGDSNGISKALADGADINAVGTKGVTPLVWVELSGSAPAMALLLERGANPDFVRFAEWGETGLQPPLWIAIDKGNVAAAKVLLQHGANANLVFGNKTPLMFAMQQGQMEIAEVLLSAGADINAKVGFSNVLTAAATLGDFKSALWVLHHGFSKDLPFSRKYLADVEPRITLGQRQAKAEALALIDQKLAAQQ